MTLNKFDASNWEFTQKIIKIGHNRSVRKHFKDIQTHNQTYNGRHYIKTALEIRDADSALETLNKMLYFNHYIRADNKATDAIASIPESWNLKAEGCRKQLAIIFRAVDQKNRSGNYTLHIPHYTGNRNPKITNYTKGNYWAQLTLSDNSHIQVNARTEAEALRVIRELQKYVQKKYLTDCLRTGQYKNDPFKEIVVKPMRADYYPTGNKNLQPEWKYYF